jgi:hypothetical protein
MGSAHNPTGWIMGDISVERRVKQQECQADTSPPYTSELKSAGDITPLPDPNFLKSWCIMACSSVQIHIFAAKLIAQK